MSDPLLRPVTELAGLVRGGEVTATQLVDACLERIEAVDGEVNAFTHVDAQGARAAAEQVQPGDERPFAGVPIAIKDGAAVAGLPISAGSDLLGDYVAAHDSFVVRRIRQAGFVIVGKTNLPEFGILPVTEPRRFGPTRNPWQLERTPGGSSGGAAAAVAAGMVPLAHGSDGGGSIRIPAACCGLVGLKATRGRISRGPDFGEDYLVQDGVLTRTVAETAELLDVLAGPEPGDASWAPPPSEPFALAAARERGKLRIGVEVAAPIEAEVDPMAEHAVREAAELLASLGHEVEEIQAPWRGRDLLQVFTTVFSSHIALNMFLASLAAEREPSPETVEPLSLEMWQHVRGRGGLDYLTAKLQLEALTRELVSVWEGGVDVLLTPALAQRPVPIGQIDASSDQPWDDFVRSGEFTPFTALFNVTGQPAISIPLFHGDDGLPLAVQLAGPPAGEAALLALAAQLEDARPWSDRRPALEAAAPGSRA